MGSHPTWDRLIDLALIERCLLIKAAHSNTGLGDLNVASQ
jgi:hypothetical protein